MKDNFLQTFIVDDEHGLMWGFAAYEREGLASKLLAKLPDPPFGLSLSPLPIVALPASIAAILGQETLTTTFSELAKPHFQTEPDNTKPTIQFAGEIMSRSLVPLRDERRGGWLRPNVELFSLAELISEANLYSYPNEPKNSFEYSPPQVFWAEYEGTSSLLINHPRAVIWGSAQPNQLFSIWKTFIEWLYR
jgi:hypothetical protein